MGFRENMDYDLNQRISSHRAFLVIMVLSFLVACYSVVTARRFMDSMQTSVILNFEYRNKPSEKSLKDLEVKNKPVIPESTTKK
jgi:hypothetical protein